MADVSSVSIKGPGSVACGRSTMAVADSSSGAIVDSASRRSVASLDRTSDVLRKDEVANLMTSLHFDAATLEPYTLVDGSTSRSAVSWTADGAVGLTLSVPPDFAGPVAGNIAWQSSGANDQATIIKVGAS